MDVSEVIVQLRARLASNRQLATLLSRSIRDPRVKRIIELLENIPPHGELIPSRAEEILQICADDPLRYRGFHPRLALLEEELSKATDFLVESSKRIILYLNHIKATGNELPESICQLTQSTLTEQKNMAVQLYQSAHSTITDALSKPPGPAPMPYDGQQDTTAAQPESTRGLVDGEPCPIGKDYDARWDPDYRMPGTQHGKFLRFPGPYFAPYNTSSVFDQFFLSETVADLIDNCNRKFEDCLANFKDTKRIRTRGDAAVLQALQKEVGDELAKQSLENYDLDAICLHTRTRPRDVTATVGPYVSCWQVRKCRIGSGVWAMEDLNRIVAVHDTGRLGNTINPMDTGCQIFFDRRISRNKQG
uniref:MAT1-1-2 n=1 Tax=Juglanconis oblonga TaxID=1940568 RepID=A0A2P1NR16_9PEZI|nr:MAT1-1-2 [Juglanconis oblonga]